MDERDVPSNDSLAGYDRLSRPIALEPGNFVVTAGLANCIAIAVYNKKIMAIAHFNTFQCHSGKNFDVKTILKWREWLKAKITGDTFAVGLCQVRYRGRRAAGLDNRPATMFRP